MWELIQAGGWLMLPIVLCSVVALIIIVERGRKLKFADVAPKHLREQLITRLRESGDIERAQLMNVKEKTPLGDILATGLLYRKYGLDSMTMHMQNRASVQIHKLEKNINMLGTIGAIAPLLGLLGTVLGIIASFLAITDGAMKDPTLLAAGVSQALITTAAGMIVAIPALVAYRFFQRRIVDINARFETEAGLLIQELHDHQLVAGIAAQKPVAKPKSAPAQTLSSQAPQTPQHSTAPQAQTAASSAPSQQAAASQAASSPVLPTASKGAIPSVVIPIVKADNSPSAPSSDAPANNGNAKS